MTYNIPDNIAQQILIWEEEKNALYHEKGYLNFKLN